MDSNIYLVNDNVHLEMTACIMTVTIYVLTELMGVTEWCVGTRAEQLVIARTPCQVQIDINKVHLVSTQDQIAPSCQ